MAMRQSGLVKGGTEACAIVGYGDRWYEPQQVRFMDDEPVRHKMLDLIVSAAAFPCKPSSTSQYVLLDLTSSLTPSHDRCCLASCNTSLDLMICGNPLSLMICRLCMTS